MPVNPKTGEWIDPPREECELKNHHTRVLFWVWVAFALVGLAMSGVGVLIGMRTPDALYFGFFIWLSLWGSIGVLLTHDFKRDIRLRGKPGALP